MLYGFGAYPKGRPLDSNRSGASPKGRPLVPIDREHPPKDPPLDSNRSAESPKDTH